MKNKKSLGSILIGLLLVSACSLNVDGIFKANTALEFIQKSIFGSKKIPINAGTYNSTISLDDSNNTVDLIIYKSSRDKAKITFKAPIENIPLDGSWVRVEASQTGQPYDVKLAAKKSVEKENELRKEYEHCTYERCHTECSGSRENRECHDVCHTYSGERYVEYYLVHTLWNIKFKLGRSNNFGLANFNGDRHDVSRDYVYQGSCN